MPGGLHARLCHACLVVITREFLPAGRLAEVEDEVLMSDEARLISVLKHRYKKTDKHARPVENSSMPIQVQFSIILRQIINVDENEQSITLKLLLHMV